MNHLLSSFTLISWLVLSPSAWQQRIHRLGENISTDFALVDLKPFHWKRKILWRLLFIGHVIWAFWTTFIVSILLWFCQVSVETLILTSSYAFFLCLVGGLLGSLTISVPFGVIAGCLGGILLSLPVGFAENIVFTMAQNIAIVVVLSFPEPTFQLQNEQPISLLSLNTALLGVFVASIAGSVTHNAKPNDYSHPQYRQLGSIVIGVLVSGIVVFLLTTTVSYLTSGAGGILQSGLLFSLVFDGSISAIFGTSIAFIWIWQTKRWLSGLVIGISITLLMIGVTLLEQQQELPISVSNFLTGMQGGMENAFLYVLLFAFPYRLAKFIANSWAGIIAGIFGSAGTYITFMVMTHYYTLDFLLPLFLLVFAIGISVTWWRPLLLYPIVSAWNLLLYQADEKRTHATKSLIHWHSAFWDEHQQLPLYGLEDYLVMVTERYPKEGKAALARISSSHQSWAAQEAQIELDARRLQTCNDIQTIRKAFHKLAAGELQGPASSLLRSFSRISRDVEAALSQESTYNQRLALDAVEDRLNGLLRELTRSSERYAIRFRPIAETWRKILANYVKTLAEAVESRQEISNPYIIGIPLTEHQEIFVGRGDVSELIEKLLLDVRCPPLLLYGQRRTGKTSLLNNLGKLLPTTIIPLFVDLQGPASLAKDYQGFLYNIARAMQTSAKRHREIILPTLSKEKLQEDPFTYFDEWLDQIEEALAIEQTVLLSLDEFSALETTFSKGRLDEDMVLGMFRHIIQHRPRFKILLSGSHTLDEFERWASYLINVQIVHLSYLQANEALQLVEQPVKDFPLHYEYAASQRVLEITRCHPALIQLVCAEIVSIKNKQNIVERRFANLNDVEAAVPGALQHGRFFFADIANNQVNSKGARLLKYVAAKGEFAVVPKEELLAQCANVEEFEDIMLKLSQRELLEPLGNGYRFQVELIRRWFSML